MSNTRQHMQPSMNGIHLKINFTLLPNSVIKKIINNANKLLDIITSGKNQNACAMDQYNGIASAWTIIKLF